MRPALIVMYHYVRPDTSEIPRGIRPLLVSEFQIQLDWLAQRYDIVHPDQFLARLKSPQARPACLLTFDDGTKDHATVVTPILKLRGLGGLFLVLSGPAEQGFLPIAHGLHWLLGMDESVVWEMFETHAGQSLGDEVDAQKIYHYETPLRARIKYAANMVLPYEVTRRIVETAVRATGRTPETLANEWFVSTDDIQAMDAAGMTIGIHGVSHRSLQSLGSDGITAEIVHCSEFLRSILGKKPNWFACPFGGSGAPHAAVQSMRVAMTQAGVIASVSTVKGYVSKNCDQLELPRLDAIDLPPRKMIMNCDDVAS